MCRPPRPYNTHPKRVGLRHLPRPRRSTLGAVGPLFAWVSWQIGWFLQRDHRHLSRSPCPTSACSRARPARLVRGTHGAAARPISRRPSRLVVPGLHRPCDFPGPARPPPPQMILPPSRTAGLPPLSTRKRRLKPAGESASPSSHVGPQPRIRNRIAPIQPVDFPDSHLSGWNEFQQRHGGHGNSNKKHDQ